MYSIRQNIRFGGYNFLFRRAKTIGRILGIPAEEVVTYNKINNHIIIPIEAVENLYNMESDIFVTKEEAQISLVRGALPKLRERASPKSVYDVILEKRLRKIEE